MLIIAGKITEKTEKYSELEKKSKNISNLLYIPHIISDNDHHFLYDSADLVLLPYRHASMSGVVFDAAMFSKTLLSTNVGCIPEYLENNCDSFIVENNYDAIEKKMDEIHNLDKNLPHEMGKSLNINISMKYNWNLIADRLVKGSYEWKKSVNQ